MRQIENVHGESGTMTEFNERKYKYKCHACHETHEGYPITSGLAVFCEECGSYWLQALEKQPELMWYINNNYKSYSEYGKHERWSKEGWKESIDFYLSDWENQIRKICQRIDKEIEKENV